MPLSLRAREIPPRVRIIKPGISARLPFCEMIIRVMNAADFTPGDFERMYEAMSPGRRERADGYLNPGARTLCILADHCIRTAVSEYCGAPPGEIVFGRSQNGKPFVEGADFHINYSHSGSFAAAAVSEYPVGIDIETRGRTDLRSTRKFATENELAYIGDSPLNFLKIWTLKEAHFKCTGEGLAGNLGSVEFSPDGISTVAAYGGFSCSTEVTDEYVLSVCEYKNESPD